MTDTGVRTKLDRERVTDRLCNMIRDAILRDDVTDVVYAVDRGTEPDLGGKSAGLAKKPSGTVKITIMVSSGPNG